MNIIASSLALRAGDEILSTDHEYGACNYTWEFICKKTGAIKEYRVEVPLIEWNGRKFVRISIQGYNNQSDLEVR